MTDKIGGGGVIPPERPVVSTPPEKPVGILGDKTVTLHNPESKLIPQQDGVRLEQTPIGNRNITHADKLSEDNLNMITALFRENKWEGARSAVNMHVLSLNQHEQLCDALTSNIPFEGRQILTDRFGVLASQDISNTLSDLPGKPEDQLDSLNLYFVQPGSAHNPIGAVARVVAGDYISDTGFDSSLKQPLVRQMEKNILQQLDEHARKLDQQVLAQADEDTARLVQQQALQRTLDISK